MNEQRYTDTELLQALSDAMGVYYNFTYACECLECVYACVCVRVSGVCVCVCNHGIHQPPVSQTHTVLRSAEPCYYNGGSFRARRGRMGPPLRLRQGVGASVKTGSCYGDWDYQWCTEITQPFTQGVGKDMFWPASPFNLNDSIANCNSTWGVVPRPLWADLNLASKDLSAASNIVFSNGELDPWRGGGVVNNVSDTVIAIVIKDGAHHLDLMFR